VAALTALRRAGEGKVALEVDGRPWRVVPDAVVLRAGLAAGVELDRTRLRQIRAELSRARALATAGRALAHRDFSSRRLEQRLERARVGENVAREAVEALEQAGVLDDARSARVRAEALARRGYGDAAIESRLEGEGFEPAHVRSALSELEPEPERARVVTRGQGGGAKAARLLARRGFAVDSIEQALGGLDWEHSGGLGYEYTE
jgi:SOS response regulatory protein OraA/RecX